VEHWEKKVELRRRRVTTRKNSNLDLFLLKLFLKK